MLKKTLLRGLNLLKLSTWLTAIVSVLLLLTVAFFVAFPQTIKTSLEERLSEISGLEVSVDKLSLEFQDNELLLAVRGLDIGTAGLNPIASIDVLRWDANLLALYRGIDIPGHIDINELIIDTSSIDEYISIINTDSIFSNLGLSGILALQTLSVNSTVLIGDESVQLAPIELKRNKEKIMLSMENQPLVTDSEMPKLSNTVNIKTSIDVARASADRVAVIPFTIKNEDFNLSAQLKIFSEQDKVYLEFQSYIDQIDVTKINQNIPEALANTQSTIWLDKVITEGVLTDIMLTTRFNISGDLEDPNTKFSANLKEAKLNVNSGWAPITDLNAKVTFSNDYVNITGKNAKLDKINLSYLNISTHNFNKPEAKLVLNGRFNSDSETISQFIYQSPVPVRVKDYLNEFELSGDIWGNVTIIAPFQQDANKKIEVDFDMYVTDNTLSLFDEKFFVKQYNSQISYHDRLIQTNGRGVIGGKLFELALNPSDWIDNNSSGLRVKMSHIDSDIDAYISKKTGDEWHTQIESKNLQVGVDIALHDDGPSIVKLNDLNITSIEEINSPWHISPENFPSFHLISKDAVVNGKPIPNLEANLISHGTVMEINTLVFENVGLSEEDLIFNGNWLNGKTVLRANASHQNLSDFLVKFGVDEPVSGGAFTADVRLFCDCNPWEVTVPKISGFAISDIEEGVFTNQDPSFFKLLSFINLESIANRMRKSRNDLREQGFVYDRINVKLFVNNGKANVDYFQVESEESDIELTGYVDLIKRNYNLAANVQPSIADTIPLATYLAGGGLAGFGVWAADKMLFGGEIIGSLFDNVLEFTYVITGPWSEPVIEKLDGVKVL
jgi:uncharacterized protein YhdP